MVRAAGGRWRPSVDSGWDPQVRGLASRHRREEGDFARARDCGVGPDMGTVDRGTDHLWVLERVRVLLTAAAKPGHEIGDSRDARGRLDLLLRLADALAHPGEIAKLH